MKKAAATVTFGLLTVAVVASLVACRAFSSDQNAAKNTSPTARSVAARVDKLFAQWSSTDSPGCSLGVSRNGVTVYERGYGMANLELKVPITPLTAFHVASVSKQFAAMSILLLAQHGQLSLDDEIRKYIPELPDYGTRLTIRHLLTHTSGLREGFTLLGLAAPREDGVDPNDAVVNMLVRQGALNFAPGSDYQYNNGGYTMLGSIVKRVSGQSLRPFADANIFKPLGMAHTHFHDDPTMIVPNRASGYHRDAGALHLPLRQDPGGLMGNAGLFTTTRDLLRWEQNFADVRVGDPALVAAMQKPTVLRGGETSMYGFGLQIADHRGLRTIGHGGGDPGFRAYAVRYPDRGLAITALCNLFEIDPISLTRRVAEIFLTDAFPSADAGPATAPVTLSPEQQSRFVGLYREPSSETFGRIFVRDGRLMASGNAGEEGDVVELTPVSANKVIVAGTSIAAELVPAAAGRPKEIRVTGAGPKNVVSEEVTASFAPSSTDLRAFAGHYYSRELDVTYIVSAADPGLVMHVPGRSDITLRPLFPDAFHGGAVDVVEFVRDQRGVVAGFTVNTSSVQRLQFDRVNR